MIGDEMAYPAVSRAQANKLVGDGLEAAGQIDNAEAAHSQTHTLANKMTFVIGTSMH